MLNHLIGILLMLVINMIHFVINTINFMQIMQLKHLRLHCPHTAESQSDHCLYNVVVPTQTVHCQTLA